MSEMNAGLLVPLLTVLFMLIVIPLIFLTDRYYRKLKQSKEEEKQNKNNISESEE